MGRETCTMAHEEILAEIRRPYFLRNRWGKKYIGSLRNFGETVQLRKPGMPTTEPSFTLGIGLGRCAEPDVHFVADALNVFKTRSVRRLVPSKQMSLLLSVLKLLHGILRAQAC